MFKDLRDLLLTVDALTTLVGDRIYSVRLPTNPEYPCICLERVTGNGDVSHSGPMDTRRWRVRVACYEPSFDTAEVVLDALRSALHGQRAEMGATRFSGFDVSEGPMVYHEELSVYGDSLDVEINWTGL